MEKEMCNHNGYCEDRVICPNVIYTLPEVMRLTGLGEKSAMQLLNDPNCNSTNIGNSWKILGSELIAYFTVRRIKEYDRYWSGKGKVNVKERKQRKGNLQGN